MAVVPRGFARELVLVDRTRARAKAVATDMRYGAPLSEVIDLRDGDYSDLAGAGLVMVTVGINEKTGGPPTAATRPAGSSCSTPTPPSIARSFRGWSQRRRRR
jgi:L-lactate dehydrogenase